MIDQEGLAIYHQRRTERLTEASVGTTVAWPTDTPLPPGYRRCEGQLLSAEEFWEYAGLPEVGVTLGSGAYAKVPDLPGMIIKVTCADEPAPKTGGLLRCGKCNTPTDDYAKHIIECYGGTSVVERQPEWRVIDPDQYWDYLEAGHHRQAARVLKDLVSHTLKASRIRITNVDGSVTEYVKRLDADNTGDSWTAVYGEGSQSYTPKHMMQDHIQAAFMRGSKVEVLATTEVLG